MYLDYSKIKAGMDNALTAPLLRLQTLSERNIGVVNGAHDIKFSIRFAELSEIEFTVPYMVDGLVNPLYGELDSYRVIYTKNHGVYLLTSPSTSGDGLKEVKTVKGYSIEKTFERKNLFLAEGTYKLYDALDNSNTVMGHILELDSSWEVRFVDQSLMNRYRSFDQYRDNALSFMYGDLMEKYRCLIVFDPYKDKETGKRGIYLYDADAEPATLPIYLSYANLLESTKVDEASDELITKLNVYGADDLSIRDVNPLGADYVVNFNHFIQNGDISATLASKIHAWQTEVDASKEYFSGVVAIRASNTAKKMSLQAELTDLKNQLTTLVTEQNAIIQAIALETEDGLANESGKTWQEMLDIKNAQIFQQKNLIADKEKEIDKTDDTISEYTDKIQAVIRRLSLESKDNAFFTDEDRIELDRYLIEDDISESSFVASSIDTIVSGNFFTTELSIQLDNIISEKIQIDEADKEMISITGGKLLIPLASGEISADIIRGTVCKTTGATPDYLCSLYLGNTKIGDETRPSGVMTLSSKDVVDSLGNDSYSVKPIDGISIFFTANVSDYQKYSVQKELYDFGVEVLDEKSCPTYEFSIEAGNFFNDVDFSVFADKITFGKGVYLMLGSHGRVIANMIGIDLDFSNSSKIDLVFSNRFQRIDGKSRLKDLLSKTYSSSRTFDASKYIYKQSVNKASQVSDFMNSSLDAAANSIIGASNQSVLINGAGIHVGGNDQNQMRIVNNMLAMTDDNWEHAKLAIGLITGPDGNQYYSINAELIMGKLLIGNSMVLENENEDGVMQFRVDGSGAWLNNARMVMQKDKGGQILIDPKYGIVAGTSDLFTVNGTTVTPSFLVDGKIELDPEGIPTNANFFLDATDGRAYFRGKVVAGSGDIGGWSIGEAGTSEEGRLYSGSGNSYVALNSSTVNDPLYAIWAGNENPASSNFYVRRDGTVKVKGDLDASSLSINGEKALDNANQITGDFLNLKGVLVGPESDPYFKVDETTGEVTVKGNITMGAGCTINWAEIESQNETSSPIYQKAVTAEEAAAKAKEVAEAAQSDADSASGIIESWCYPDTTKINGTSIQSGTISASYIKGGTLEGVVVKSTGRYGDIVISDSEIKLGTSGSLYGDDWGSVFLRAPSKFRLYMSNENTGGSCYMEFSGNGIDYYRENTETGDYELVSYCNFIPKN